MDFRKTAEHIFLAGVREVLPGKIISDLVSLRGSVLKIGDHTADLDGFDKIYVLGAGKASAALGHYLENLLGARITSGEIITKYGFYCRLRRIKVTEAGHPIPDENGFAATRSIQRIADMAAAGDLVICIWSGGGSALLADYPGSSTIQEIMFFNDMLVRCGASIHEINSVRKHLSNVKGGLLARRINPAALITLYLSDVTGDTPEVVASGPTVPDTSSFGDALQVIEKYRLKDDMPASLLDHILDGVRGVYADTPKPGDDIFTGSKVFLAGNNMKALKASATEAEQAGFTTIIAEPELKGDISEACSHIIDLVNWYRNDPGVRKPVCLLFGGETTVRVTGEGLGGRNQHLALLTALRLQNIRGVTFLSAGTDGNDGNTDAAGAVVDSETVHDALSMNIVPEDYLGRFDSNGFFRRAGGLILTGPTMTNVMDVAIALIE